MSQPYQRASKAIREGEESSVNLIQNAAMAYTGGKALSAGYSAVNKVLPAVGAFLSNYVPENLAIKGLSKIDPRMGEFMKGAMNEGFTFDDIKGFIGEKVAKTQQAEKKNIIKQYDPELHTYIDEKIKGGSSLVEAGEKAMKHGRFARIIKDLVRDHKTSWSSILQSVFGQADNQSDQMPQDPQQPAQQPPALQPEISQQPQSSQNNQALMSILQKIQQARGG